MRGKQSDETASLLTDDLTYLLSSSSLNTNEIENKKLSYKLNRIILDLILLALAGYSQFGYAVYWQKSALISVTDPLHRYLYPHISSNQADNVTSALSEMMNVLSMADAILTTATFLNMRRCREEFIKEWKTGIIAYKKEHVPLFLFLVNNFLIWGFFIIGSFSPWAGFSRAGYSNLMTSISGPIMFLGLMISYTMTFSSYIFSGSLKLNDFYNLDRQQKKAIFNKIFLSRKGILGFLPRTLLSALNRSWGLYGGANLIMTWVFNSENLAAHYIFAILAAICIGYQGIMSQSIKDYHLTFTNHPTKVAIIHSTIQQISPNDRNINCYETLFFIYKIILIILTIMVFLLRTLATPSLYTGTIDDPTNNYDGKDAAITAFGLLSGGYAAYQFCQFRYTLSRDNVIGFFTPKVNQPEEDSMEERNNFLL